MLTISSRTGQAACLWSTDVPSGEVAADLQGLTIDGKLPGTS